MEVVMPQSGTREVPMHDSSLPNLKRARSPQEDSPPPLGSSRPLAAPLLLPPPGPSTEVCSIPCMATNLEPREAITVEELGVGDRQQDVLSGVLVTVEVEEAASSEDLLGTMGSEMDMLRSLPDGRGKGVFKGDVSGVQKPTSSGGLSARDALIFMGSTSGVGAPIAGQTSPRSPSRCPCGGRSATGSAGRSGGSCGRSTMQGCLGERGKGAVGGSRRDGPEDSREIPGGPGMLEGDCHHSVAERVRAVLEDDVVEGEGCRDPATSS